MKIDLAQIQMFGDRYFQSILRGFESRFLAGGKLDPGEIAPHRELRSMDYILTHALNSATHRKDVQELVTRQGWIFVCTGILAEYTGAYNGLIPQIRIIQEEVNQGSLSGSMIGSPAMRYDDFGWISISNGFGPSHTGEGVASIPSQFLTEPRDFFRVFGNADQIKTEARLDASDSANREVNVILHGWEFKE